MKTIEIKCNAEFICNNIKDLEPVIKMYVLDIDSDMFEFRDTDDIINIRESPLHCVVNNIVVYNELFYDKIYPRSGYIPVIDIDNNKASFSINAKIYDKNILDPVSVTFVFIAEINDDENVNNYYKMLDNIKYKKLNDAKKSKEIMDFLRS